MKTVLFALNASYIHKNLAVRCLAPRLKEKGFDAVIIEKNIKDRRLSVLEALYTENAEVYCFSCYIWNIAEMKTFAAQLKRLLPKALIIFGGPEVSYENEGFFSTAPYVDFIVAGEGEQSLPALCLDIKECGAAAAAEQGRIVNSSPYCGFENAGILYPEDEVFESSVLYYESSRGCPYSCAYCLSAAEKGVRAKDAGLVLSELMEFEKLSGSIKVIKLVDRTFNYDRKRAAAVWRGLLSECYTKKYHFEICAELLDDEAFDIISKFPAGKVQFEAGVQSTNTDTLAAIDRTSDIKLCLSNLKRLREKGNAHIHADLIAGLPLEDMKSFSRSFDDVYGCCDMLQLGFLKVLRGSPLEKRASFYGIEYSPEPPYEVLKTGCLSFDELYTLHKVDFALDRYSNSGHFFYTLKAIMKYVKSPFRFFLSLAERAAETENMPQIKAIQILREVCLSIAPQASKEILGSLRLDFYIWESGTCPAILSGDAELPTPPASRLLIIKEAGGKIFAPASEVHRFSFDPEGYYLIDRKNHVCYRREIV